MSNMDKNINSAPHWVNDEDISESCKLTCFNARRAKMFYSKLLEKDLHLFKSAKNDNTYFLIHNEAKKIFATLVNKISSNSTNLTASYNNTDTEFAIITYADYFQDLKEKLKEVEKNGGKVLTTNSCVNSPFKALIQDLEGNRIALLKQGRSFFNTLSEN